jgi:hypothetical protein
METNEIMTTNEAVIEEVTEEIANADSGKAMKIAAKVGLAVLAGVAIYKFAVKPLVAKAKAKKEAKARTEDDIYECDDFAELDDEVETID